MNQNLSKVDNAVAQGLSNKIIYVPAAKRQHSLCVIRIYGCAHLLLLT